MSGAEILTAGKALIWFAIPIALAIWELTRIRRERTRDRQARADQDKG